MSGASRGPTLLGGIAVALVLSLSGAALLGVLAPLLGASAAVRIVVALLGLAYLLYTLAVSAERMGRISTVAVWAAGAAVAWLTEPSLGVYLLLHAGMIWLARSLYHYSSLLSALADLALTALAAAFAVWAAGRAGSAWLALWCFFLVQAFHVWLPVAIRGSARRAARDTAGRGEAFERAHGAAEAALRRLAETR